MQIHSVKYKYKFQNMHKIFFLIKKICRSVKDNLNTVYGFQLFTESVMEYLSIHVLKVEITESQKNVHLPVFQSYFILCILSYRIFHFMPLSSVIRDVTEVPNQVFHSYVLVSFSTSFFYSS